MPDVRCTVSNCAYWAEGNQCVAEAIWVVADDVVSRIGKDDQEAGEIGQIGRTPARVSKETCCYTFRRKESAAKQQNPS